VHIASRPSSLLDSAIPLHVFFVTGAGEWGAGTTSPGGWEDAEAELVAELEIHAAEEARYGRRAAEGLARSAIDAVDRAVDNIVYP